MEANRRCVVDNGTGKIYNNDDVGTVAEKCIALMLGNATINLALNVPMTMVGRTGLAVSCLLHGKYAESGKNLARGAGAPVLWGVMQGATFVGMVSPLNGRKLYGRAEKHMAFQLAPCFQPIARLADKRSKDELQQRSHGQHGLGVNIGNSRW